MAVRSDVNTRIIEPSSPLTNDMPSSLQLIVVGKHLFYAVDVRRRAGNFDRIGAQVDGHVQTIFQQAQVFVAGTKQGFDIRAYLNILLHSGSEDCLQLGWGKH